MYFAGQNLGDLCARNGVPFFSPEGRQWIFTVTGRWPCFDSINFDDDQDGRTANDRAHPHPESAGTDPPRVEFPERLEFETKLSHFLTLDVVDIFPFVDEVLIHRTIQAAYQDSNTSRKLGQINARACILAVFALINAHYGSTGGPCLVNPDDYIKEAKRMLISDGIEGASLVTLETVVLLMMYEVPNGRLASAHMLHATACRAVFALGGHKICPSTPKGRAPTIQEREDLHLRDLFWLCYKLDKDIALRTGQPPLIADEFCNLSLPDYHMEGRFGAATAKLGSSYGRRIPQLPGDLQLDLLKSKACKLLYSADSSRKSDAELLRAIRELDDELEGWRVSLPAKFSPSLSVLTSKALDEDLSVHGRMLHIDLHLQYHHLLAVIHCASGRCTAAAASGTGMRDPDFGVQSSLEISVEASRSTLVYLKEAGHSIVSEAFWVFLCYPISALMIIFFNILRRPLAEQANQDVELLRSSIALIRSMPIKKVTPYDVEYLERIENFISELGTLGDCAIQKARIEQSRTRDETRS